MKYAFDLNEAIISTIAQVYMGSGVEAVGNYVGRLSDLRYDQIERRSPAYVKKSTYILSLGSQEATNAYINRLETYQQKGDMMRIMRALAGVTFYLIYVILWYIMIWQLLVFIYIYFKRYLMIAFLIAIFPITLFEYIVGIIKTGKQSGISEWSREFFTNVFLQTIHAITYGIITGVCMSQIRASMLGEGGIKLNWFLMLCAINFVFTGERILKSIMNAGSAQSVVDADNVSKGARGGMGKIRNAVGKGFNKLTGEK